MSKFSLNLFFNVNHPKPLVIDVSPHTSIPHVDDIIHHLVSVMLRNVTLPFLFILAFSTQIFSVLLSCL
jgi:hypothetical protein